MDPLPSESSRPSDDDLPIVSEATAEEQALAAFGAWIDAELEKFVARWIHLAAPNAQRPRRANFGR